MIIIPSYVIPHSITFAFPTMPHELCLSHFRALKPHFKNLTYVTVRYLSLGKPEKYATMVFIPSRYFIQFLQTPIMVLIYIYKEVKLGYEFLTLGGPQCLNLWFPCALACGIFFCEGYNNLGGVS